MTMYSANDIIDWIYRSFTEGSLEFFTDDTSPKCEARSRLNWPVFSTLSEAETVIQEVANALNNIGANVTCNVDNNRGSVTLQFTNNCNTSHIRKYIFELVNGKVATAYVELAKQQTELLRSTRNWQRTYVVATIVLCFISFWGARSAHKQYKYQQHQSK